MYYIYMCVCVIFVLCIYCICIPFFSCMCIYIVLYMFYIRNTGVFSSILNYGFYMFHMFITYNQHFIYIYLHVFMYWISVLCIHIYTYICAFYMYIIRIIYIYSLASNVHDPLTDYVQPKKHGLTVIYLLQVGKVSPAHIQERSLCGGAICYCNQHHPTSNRSLKMVS